MANGAGEMAGVLAAACPSAFTSRWRGDGWPRKRRAPSGWRQLSGGEERRREEEDVVASA